MIIYIFLQFSMEISKQNYLIGSQIFATAYYLISLVGTGKHFHNFCYKEGLS